jgi:hypothetical protein
LLELAGVQGDCRCSTSTLRRLRDRQGRHDALSGLNGSALEDCVS